MPERVLYVLLHEHDRRNERRRQVIAQMTAGKTLTPVAAIPPFTDF